MQALPGTPPLPVHVFALLPALQTLAPPAQELVAPAPPMLLQSLLTPPAPLPTQVLDPLPPEQSFVGEDVPEQVLAVVSPAVVHVFAVVVQSL